MRSQLQPVACGSARHMHAACGMPFCIEDTVETRDASYTCMPKCKLGRQVQEYSKEFIHKRRNAHGSII